MLPTSALDMLAIVDVVRRIEVGGMEDETSVVEDGRRNEVAYFEYGLDQVLINSASVLSSLEGLVDVR